MKWECKNCKKVFTESQLTTREFINKLSKKNYKEITCGYCGSLDVFPTKKEIKNGKEK